MQLILREEVDNLGKRGQIVNVSRGFARNYLLPQRLAMEVSDNNLRLIEKERKVYEAKLAKEKEEAEVVAGALSAVKLTFRRKVHGEGQDLYGSVSLADLAEALEGQGVPAREAKDTPPRASEDDRRVLDLGETAPRGYGELPGRRGEGRRVGGLAHQKPRLSRGVDVAAETSALERTLPHSMEAERTVLGAILIENEAFHNASEILTERDFYRDAHRRIFLRMAALSARGDAIDLVTLREELSRSGDLEPIGGVAYLSSLLEGVPRATNVPYYSRIVKDKAVLRNLISAANRISQSCFGEVEETQVVLDEAEKTIFEIAEGAIRSGFQPVSEIVKKTFKHIDELSEKKELVTGVATGFVEFDEITSGLQRSDLIIVAARPAM